MTWTGGPPNLPSPSLAGLQSAWEICWFLHKFFYIFKDLIYNVPLDTMPVSFASEDGFQTPWRISFMSPRFCLRKCSTPLDIPLSRLLRPQYSSDKSSPGQWTFPQLLIRRGNCRELSYVQAPRWIREVPPLDRYFKVAVDVAMGFAVYLRVLIIDRANWHLSNDTLAFNTPAKFICNKGIR